MPEPVKLLWNDLMNKQDLKNMLKKQASSFSSDVRKKMVYLRSEYQLGEDFHKQMFSTPSEPQKQNVSGHKENNDVEVFSFSRKKTDISQKKSSSIQHNSDTKKTVSLSEKKAAFEKRKRYFSERIASLRGLSLPGDYLRHHS